MNIKDNNKIIEYFKNKISDFWQTAFDVPSGCVWNPKVTDVSMLSNVHTLYLSYTNVTDVSMLSNVNIIR